jgi:hypothetical protein
MKPQKTTSSTFKSVLYLSLLGIILSFSAFSCEVYEPLEIRIENKTGYDLTEIRINEVTISSLKNNETSNYISTTNFEYMNPLFAKIHRKFERELRSNGMSKGTWCSSDPYPTKQSGKYNFVITLHQYDNGTEYLRFEEK